MSYAEDAQKRYLEHQENQLLVDIELSLKTSAINQHMSVSRDSNLFIVNATMPIREPLFLFSNEDEVKRIYDQIKELSVIKLKFSVNQFTLDESPIFGIINLYNIRKQIYFESQGFFKKLADIIKSNPPNTVITYQ